MKICYDSLFGWFSGKEEGVAAMEGKGYPSRLTNRQWQEMDNKR